MVVRVVCLLLRDSLLILLNKEEVLCQHLPVEVAAELLHVEQQSFQSLAQPALVPIVILGKGKKLPLHGFLEDPHVYFLIERQQLLLQLPVDHYLVEIQHPFFDLIVDGDIVEELREVGCDEFL